MAISLIAGAIALRAGLLAVEDKGHDPTYDPPGSPQVPSKSAGSDVCGACFQSAHDDLNKVRYRFEKRRRVYQSTKAFANAGLLFGDNTASIHAIAGLAWQTERRKVEQALRNLDASYDEKHGELNGVLQKAVRQQHMTAVICARLVHAYDADPMAGRRAVAVLWLVALAAWACPTEVLAQATTAAAAPAQQAPASTWRWNGLNLTRVEAWRFFPPPDAGGDPDYLFIANRLRVGLDGTWKHFDFNAAAQYVQFGGLPGGAVGPGALGTGALYYQHAGQSDSHGVYVRTLSLRARLPRGVTVQAGRFGYASGAEAPSGRPKIEAVKRSRIDARMIGEFEWSLYQRTFDGARVDADSKAWHVTGAWLRPTQGGFEETAGSSISDIDVFAGTVALRPGVVLPKTDLAFFGYRYDDDRRVSARPDNSGRSASRVDVGITTLGAAAAGAAAAGKGDIDWLAWLATQTGSWYGQTHRAWSLAIEAGYQWKAPWQPWVRGGYLNASGDGSPSDNRHGTFFPMLPTARKYSMTTAYATMNLRDLFAEAIVQPTPKVTARAGVRRLWLANGHDLWYAGSGATQNQGTYFGYAGRRSGGSTDLASAVIEGGADVTLAKRWSVNGFLGVIHGGQVVATSFPGHWLRFFYVENVVRW